MLTLISFIVTIVGAINWFCIGILQFDFVAGLFGSQSSIFSRIIYTAVGIGAIMLLFNFIKNKGRIVFDYSKKEKKNSSNNFQKHAHQMEAGNEVYPERTRPMDLEAGAEVSPYANSKFVGEENRNYNMEASSFNDQSREQYNKEQNNPNNYNSNYQNSNQNSNNDINRNDTNYR